MVGNELQFTSPSRGCLDFSAGLTEGALQSRGERLKLQHVEMLREFGKQFGEVTAHLICKIDAEASYGIRFAFGIDLRHAEVEQVGAYPVGPVFLISQQLQ